MLEYLAKPNHDEEGLMRETFEEELVKRYFSSEKLGTSFSPTEIVFIDDYQLLTIVWKESAEAAGKTISVFTDPFDFMEVAHNFPLDTSIYIDSSLKDLKGEDFARVLYKQGYCNIILATGFPKERFEQVTWVKDIIDKEPPWG